MSKTLENSISLWRHFRIYKFAIAVVPLASSAFVSHRDYTAINVYVALCYYKLDYYDVSQEVLHVYMQVR